MQRAEVPIALNVSNLQKSPAAITAILAKADGEVAVVLNHNRVMPYMVPAAGQEAMMERINDLGLAGIARAYADGEPMRISLDAL